MAAQWPLVKAQLTTVLPTLPGWSGVTVFNGAPTRRTLPNDFATVGYVDNDQAGSYTLVQDPDGSQMQETGFVRCQIACSGGGVESDPESRVFALADAFETYIRADRRLGGVLSQQGTTTLAVDVATAQSDQGTAVALVVALHYFTVT